MTYEKIILVTGGAGFIGLNFIAYFLEKYPNYVIINLDKLTYAANTKELEKLNIFSNHRFVKGDINDRPLIEKLFEEQDINSVIHFAAESHVDRSIEAPNAFIETNVNGTFTLLDVAKKHWLKAGNSEKNRFHHISTDEVYGSLENEGCFKENSPYMPNSPYSASKASSDLLVRSYHQTYGLNTIITNCSNNFGPKQHDEKLIPTIIRKALNLESIPIYGDGKNIRDWLFVRDHCIGIDTAFHHGSSGETYNIGANNEHTNIEMAEILCGILDERVPVGKNHLRISSYKKLISFVADRPGHDRRYAVDTSKIQRHLGWKATEPFNHGLRKTVEWYIHEYKPS